MDDEYKITAECILLLRKGEPISNGELEVALCYLPQIILFLEAIGLEYGLAASQLRRDLGQFQAFHRARNE